jgi:uncharacterized protein (TIGR02147 family)
MSVYEFEDYKNFFNHWVESLPKNGHGEYRRVALALNVSTTMISQVFKGDKELSLELACDLCEYLNMGEDEADYFLLMVEHRRAGSAKLQKRLHRQILQRQEKALSIDGRPKKAAGISEDVQKVFFSSWIYAGVRALASCEGFNDAAGIAQKMNLPRNQVQKVLDFLVDHGFLNLKKGELSPGPARLPLATSGIFSSKHHQNWRLQGFNKMPQAEDKNLFYTAPLSLSEDQAEKLRQEILILIEKVLKSAQVSEAETTRCLNIDWFDV